MPGRALVAALLGEGPRPRPALVLAGYPVGSGAHWSP
jgi:hypothetical protein